VHQQASTEPSIEAAVTNLKTLVWDLIWSTVRNKPSPEEYQRQLWENEEHDVLS
jgi:hypothetical protein